MKPTINFIWNIGTYVTVGRHLYRKFKFYNPQKQTIRYQEWLHAKRYMEVAWTRKGLATHPYYDSELIVLLNTHVPSWPGFKTQYFTFLQPQMILSDGEVDLLTAKFVEIEKPLLQRDRLAQIFGACGKGTYGWYAKRGLAPFKAVVGSWGSATIDEFFAKNIQLLNQPFGALVNDIMSTQETRYWQSQQDLRDWLAGHFLTKGGREKGVSWPAAISQFFEDVPETTGEKLSQQQLAEIKAALEKELSTLEVVVLEHFLADDEEVLKLYRQLAEQHEKNRS